MLEMSNDFYVTDDDCMQCCKELGNNAYLFIQAIWVDITDENKIAAHAIDETDNYVVVSDLIDVDGISKDEIEDYIDGYYDSLEDMEQQYERKYTELGELIAECAFEQLWCSTSHISEVVSWDDAEAIVQNFINSDGKSFGQIERSLEC